jgi:hypothetical protein
MLLWKRYWTDRRLNFRAAIGQRKIAAFQPLFAIHNTPPPPSCQHTLLIPQHTMSSDDSNDSRLLDPDYSPPPAQAVVQLPAQAESVVDTNSSEPKSVSICKQTRLSARNLVNSLGAKVKRVQATQHDMHTKFTLANTKLELRTNHCVANSLNPLEDNEFMILKVDFNGALAAHNNACDKVAKLLVELDEARQRKALADQAVQNEQDLVKETARWAEGIKKRRYDESTAAASAVAAATNKCVTVCLHPLPALW